MEGSVHDDGRPQPYTVTWSQDSGPAPVSFDNVSSKRTTASFSQVGTYIIRLSATDSEKSSYDTLVIEVIRNTGRVTAGLRSSYSFNEQGGAIIRDSSDSSPALDLSIQSLSAVTWISEGGLRVDNSAKIKAISASSDLIRELSLAEEFTIEAWVKPASIRSNHSTPILTIGRNTKNSNLVLEQVGDKVQLQLRTTQHRKQHFKLGSANGSLTTDLTHIVFTRDSAGKVTLYVNALEKTSATAQGTLSNWDLSFDLSLVKFPSGKSQGWSGEYHLIAIYERALAPDEVLQNYDVGPNEQLGSPFEIMDMVENMFWREGHLLCTHVR